jgi:hypothetical protein
MNFWDMYHCLLFSSIRDVCHELLGHVPLFAIFFYKTQKFMTNIPYRRKQQTMVHVPEVHDKRPL